MPAVSERLIGTIVCPGRTKGQNAIAAPNFHALGKIKKKIRDDAILLGRSAISIAYHFYAEAPYDWEKRKLVITSYRKSLLDDAAESLAGGACKHIIDGLKIWATSKDRGAGVIVDDSQKWCSREYAQVQIKKCDPKGERLEIAVYEESR